MEATYQLITFFSYNNNIFCNFYFNYGTRRKLVYRIFIHNLNSIVVFYIDIDV